MIKFTTLRADSADEKLIFLVFFKKTCFDISCILSLMETVCMKCKICFLGKIRENTLNSNMTLTFFRGTFWKHYCDQTIVIRVINVVHAKGHV